MLYQGDLTFTVEAALGQQVTGDVWDSAIWDTSVWSGLLPQFQNITSYVQAFSTRYGIDYFGDQFRAGKAVVICDNSTGAFNPESGASLPGALIMRPGRLIRITASRPGGASRVLFYGIVDTMDETYGRGGDDSTMRLLCTDYLSVFNRNQPEERDTPISAGESTSARVTRLLNELEWPDADRLIETGIHTMASSVLPDNRLQELRNAATAEGGAIYQEEDRMVFRNLNWPDNTQPVVAFPGRGLPGDPAILDVDADWSLANVRNYLTLARAGGQVNVFVNSASELYYNGRYTYTFRNYQCQDDTQLQALGDKILALRSWDYQRLISITLQSMEDTAAADTILGLDVGDLLQVAVPLSLRGWGYTTQVFVAGCTWQVTEDDWAAEYRVDDASRIAPDDAAAFTEGYDLGWYS